MRGKKKGGKGKQIKKTKGKGGSPFPNRINYEVTVCPIAGPLSACITQRTSGPNRRRMLETPASVATFEGLNPLTT